MSLCKMKIERKTFKRQNGIELFIWQKSSFDKRFVTEDLDFRSVSSREKSRWEGKVNKNGFICASLCIIIALQLLHWCLPSIDFLSSEKNFLILLMRDFLNWNSSKCNLSTTLEFIEDCMQNIFKSYSTNSNNFVIIKAFTDVINSELSFLLQQ